MMDSTLTTIEELKIKYPPLEESIKLLKARKRIASDGSIILLSIVLPILLLGLWLSFEYSWIFFAIAVILVFVLYCSTVNIDSRTHRYVSDFIAARNINDENLLMLWQSKERFQIASTITSLCIKHIEWSNNAVFLPDDSFSLMLSSKTGDLEDVECVEDIEEKFSIKFPHDFFLGKRKGYLKFRDIVDYINQNENLP